MARLFGECRVRAGLRSTLKVDVPRHAPFPRYQLLTEIVLQGDPGEGVFEQVGVGLDAGTGLGGVEELFANASGNTAPRAGEQANVFCGLKHGSPAWIVP